MSSEETTYFFSYTRDDADFVLKLAQELRDIGINLWLDQLDITGGERWDRAVEEALAACQGMIVVLSPASVDSHNVMDEVSYALEENKLVVPVLHKARGIPFRLRRVQRFTADYAQGLADLLRALSIEQAEPTPASTEVEASVIADVAEPEAQIAQKITDDKFAPSVGARIGIKLKKGSK